MANFDIPTSPEFSTDMRKLESTDPASAEIFNTLFEQLLKNDAALKVGTTPAGDAKKVGGFLPTQLMRWYNHADTETDCNNVITTGFHRCKKFINYPPEHSDGQGIMIVLNYGSDNMTKPNSVVGTDTIWLKHIFISPHTGKMWERYYNGVTVKEWKPMDAGLLEGFTAEQVGESGVRNLIPYPYEETSNTENGITWTDVGDGTIIANGTATADSVFKIKPFSVAKGTYTLSGSPDIDGCAINLANLKDNANDWTMSVNYTRATKTVTYDNEFSYNYCRCVVVKGTTVENAVFKPMLERGSVAHGYVPYYSGGALHADTVDGYHASEFLKAESVVFVSGETVLDWVNNPQGVFRKFAVVGNGYPTDGVQQEGWYDLYLQHNNSSRKKVVFTPYNRYAKTYTRKAWENEWTDDNWVESIDSTGGTLTGNITVERENSSSLILKNTAFTRDGSLPSAHVYNNIQFYDAENANLGLIQNVVSKDTGNVFTNINAYRNNAIKEYAQLGVKFNSDGEHYPFYNYNGKTEYKMLHSGNVGEHALSISGGTLTGNVTIEKSEPIIILKNTSGDTAHLKFQNDGNLGLNCTDADGSSCALSLMPSKGAGKMARIVENGSVRTILHSGNSAAVAIQESAPSDTSALWVW